MICVNTKKSVVGISLLLLLPLSTVDAVVAAVLVMLSLPLAPLLPALLLGSGIARRRNRCVGTLNCCW